MKLNPLKIDRDLGMIIRKLPTVQNIAPTLKVQLKSYAVAVREQLRMFKSIDEQALANILDSTKSDLTVLQDNNEVVRATSATEFDKFVHIYDTTVDGFNNNPDGVTLAYLVRTLTLLQSYLVIGGTGFVYGYKSTPPIIARLANEIYLASTYKPKVLRPSINRSALSGLLAVNKTLR